MLVDTKYIPIIEKYSKESNTAPRSLNDLSPMEEWLLKSLHEANLPETFWKRLGSFVSDVQTGCAMGEEDKQMILFVCKEKIKS